MKNDMTLGLKALGANTAILSVVTLAEFELILKIVLLMMTIAFTAFQFWKSATKKEGPKTP